MRAITFALALLTVTVGYARETPFSRDVNQSINDGLNWLIAQNAFDGGRAGEAAGLVALTLLEKPRSPDQDAAPQGYEQASAADKRHIDSIMDYIIGRGAANISFKAYRDGSNMMALTVYIVTGGPRQNDARTALNNIFDRTIAKQNGTGYWCYTDGSCNDSSTTQLVMAGLAAARTVYSDPDTGDAGRLNTLNQRTQRTRTAYQNNGRNSSTNLGNGEKGHGYRSTSEPSYQQTASGLWCQIIGGADISDPSVQNYLRWLYQRYNYLSINTARNSWNKSYYYYLWSSAKSVHIH